MTPRGHAVQACRKKNVKGGLEPEPTGFGAPIDGVDMDSPAPPVSGQLLETRSDLMRPMMR
jgi:hypothetical protein